MPRVITTGQARAAGMPIKQYRRLRRVFHGVRALPGVSINLPVLVEAARTFLPDDAVATGVTALRLHQVPVGADLPLQFVSTEPVRVRRHGVIARQAAHLPPQSNGVATPLAALAQVVADLPALDAVIMGDRLIQLKVLSEESVRAVAPLCRGGAESPQETKLRLTLVLAGLPEPELQVTIRDGDRFLGRVDGSYRRYKIIIEYEGDQHRERAQWDVDISRYEELGRLGWIIIRVTVQRLRHPAQLVDDVYRELRSRGYRGPAPRLDAAWLAQVAA